jgi:hypothetical protein
MVEIRVMLNLEIPIPNFDLKARKFQKKRDQAMFGLFNFWWRRGRVELPVQKKLPGTYYKLSQSFNLIQSSSRDQVRPDQPINLS